MPNRVLKESILTSETVGSLDHISWRLFVSLICLADDYGRGKANPTLLKGLVFPLCEVSVKQIEKSLQRLVEVDAIRLYTVDDSHYFYFPKWLEHQTPRAKESKYPDPKNCSSPQMQADENICKQMQASANKCISYTNTNTNTNTNNIIKEERHRYGEYNNVLLTDDELEKLKAEYPDYKDWIERLSSYIASSGKSYKSHYATIRNWARSEKTSKQDSKVAKPSMTDYYNEDVAKWLENAYGKDNEFNKILGETK